MTSIVTDYISVGGNKHPSAADWDPKTGLLAFGADNNVSLWKPSVGGEDYAGISTLLSGHKDKVNAVKFLPDSLGSTRILVTGSADHTVRLWLVDLEKPARSVGSLSLEDHKGSVNTIAAATGSRLFASAAADGTVKVWRVGVAENLEVSLVHTITLTPRYLPLALGLHCLRPEEDTNSLLLAVGGTRNVVQIFVLETCGLDIQCTLQATLTGHEGWIRSLAFRLESTSPNSDLLLASASQDKYIRLWRLHEGVMLPAPSTDPALGTFGQTLSNKAHWIKAGQATYSITFEALLLGHEDWIYSTSWSPDSQRLRLMSASADNSLTIWEPDPASGVWVSNTRLGEISAQKGSTSATGSTGGFWIGLWSPAGDAVVSLGRSGSWKLWVHDSSAGEWVQRPGISGHVKTVTALAWEDDGNYLLSASSDQTTRFHAEWLHSGSRTWHEFSRPQIHGYDLNCVGSLGLRRFVSGADEKLLRVFDQPRAVAELVQKLCGIEQTQTEAMPEAANMPVLGLSNKATEDESLAVPQNGPNKEGEAVHASNATSDQNYPPTEDQLARHTLWPELEKLYGHGYEISALATSHDNSLIATACKASSLDHAVIRLYDTSDWHEIKPSLIAHSLTVTSLCFSGDDEHLLSVGRDRQWAVFKRNPADDRKYSIAASNPKGHSRMILDAAWFPVSDRLMFATASRDKTAKIWEADGQSFTCKTTISMPQPVTAVAVLPSFLANNAYLALGEEGGAISLHLLVADTLDVTKSTTIAAESCPSKTITRLVWRPQKEPHEPIEDGRKRQPVLQLAAGSEDSSMRIYRVSQDM